MNYLTSKDLTDTCSLLLTYGHGKVYLLQSYSVRSVWEKVVQGLGMVWSKIVDQDPKHLKYVDTLDKLYESLENAPYSFIHTDLEGNVLGCIILEDAFSMHRDNFVASTVNINTGGSYRKFLSCIKDKMKADGYSCIALSNVKGKYHTVKYIDL